jgi:hypothetical protein
MFKIKFNVNRVRIINLFNLTRVRIIDLFNLNRVQVINLFNLIRVQVINLFNLNRVRIIKFFNHQHVAAPRFHLWLSPISKDKNNRTNCRGLHRFKKTVFLNRILSPQSPKMCMGYMYLNYSISIIFKFSISIIFKIPIRRSPPNS